MLKFYNYDIVFSEIPDEVTLAINISGCPNHCKGCHSPWLWEDAGFELDSESLYKLISEYSTTITCVCIMGGDAAPLEVEQIANFVHIKFPQLKVGWYSGKTKIPDYIHRDVFRYIKLGPYIQSLGGLDSRQTNQRLYQVQNEKEIIDITSKFWKK